jgi:soluble lytic murein transglycosylase-like protein
VVRKLLPAVAALAFLGWTAGPAAASVPYRVQAGDTLTAIAASHHTTVPALARLNRLDPERFLPVGLVLRLPHRRAGQSLAPYVVRRGDTLSGIAAAHRITLAYIVRVNHLEPDALLLEGQRILVPRARSSRQAIQASIRRWAGRYRIPQSLALALAWQESGHQSDVVSEAGAVGVMQVMPKTRAYVESVLIGRPIPDTADGNVRVGLAYLRHLLNLFGNTQRALAAYLQGDESVRTQGIFRSTRRYIANILAIAGRVDSSPV